MKRIGCLTVQPNARIQHSYAGLKWTYIQTLQHHSGRSILIHKRRINSTGTAHRFIDSNIQRLKTKPRRRALQALCRMQDPMYDPDIAFDPFLPEIAFFKTTIQDRNLHLTSLFTSNLNPNDHYFFPKKLSRWRTTIYISTQPKPFRILLNPRH